MAKNCYFFRDNDEFEWELFSSSGQGSYAALGLSDDKKMGDDLVMSCASVSTLCTSGSTLWPVKQEL